MVRKPGRKGRRRARKTKLPAGGVTRRGRTGDQMDAGTDPLREALRAAASERVDAALAAASGRRAPRAVKAAPRRVARPKAKAKPTKKKVIVSPLAPTSFPTMPPVAGVRLATGEAGVRYRDRTDLLLMVFDPGTTVAGVFTTSKTASAPVEWCRRGLENGAGRALVVNSGNANAFTGFKGVEAARSVARTTAELVKCRQSDVFMASTGVIGEVLPTDRIVAALGDLASRLEGDGWDRAARAIMTTDTFPKGAVRTARIDDAEVTISGIAKGSGMIAPDMATMLSFVATDAAIPPDVLQTLLLVAVKDSFNCITVDGDTSTSDTVLLFATGRGPGHKPVRRAGDPQLKDFREKLSDLMGDLARQIVRDGEGATKFVTVRVTGAESHVAAKRIAMSIANSPLVKTAIAGADPNWGRIVMAVGKAGEKADRDKISIALCGQSVVRQGEPDPDYREARAAVAMKGAEIDIDVDVGVGRGQARVWTCDLTARYIEINADYRS